jgi:hypothetical protein
MGANKAYPTKSNNRLIIGESDEFKRLRHAIAKALAIASERSPLSAGWLEALPRAIREATLSTTRLLIHLTRGELKLT